MEIQGTIEGKNIEVADMEFAVEIDSYDLFKEISDDVEECASEAISNYMAYNAPEVDFNEGASNLLHEYNPGNGCSLARDFEAAVQGAVQVDNWLVDLIGAEVTKYNQSHSSRFTVSVADEIRKVVRSEVRMALATALGTLTNGEEA